MINMLASWMLITVRCLYAASQRLVGYHSAASRHIFTSAIFYTTPLCTQFSPLPYTPVFKSPTLKTATETARIQPFPVFSLNSTPFLRNPSPQHRAPPRSSSMSIITSRYSRSRPHPRHGPIRIWSRHPPDLFTPRERPACRRNAQSC